jgi:hypothetical protein
MRKYHREQAKAIESSKEFRVVEVEDTKNHVNITVEIVETKQRFRYVVSGTPKYKSVNKKLELNYVRKAAAKFRETAAARKKQAK